MEYIYPLNVCFDCNGCGLCCGDTEHKTRHILLLDSEAKNISAHTNLSIEKFTQENHSKEPYVYEMKKSDEGKCIFLKDNLCLIYQDRPLICRFYPFELNYDNDKEIHYFSYTLECPTMNKTGQMLTKKYFEKLFSLAKQRLL
ncbi:MAG: YkgJ family cysteine cluster protein [Candidatus Bathyarchaeota archaeon]|nr:YkgJ family cysteine cluster protein [Candidatus Bathyarchaeota archaeon]